MVQVVKACTFSLNASLNVFCSCPRSFLYYSNHALLQSLVKSANAASSREISYGTMGFNNQINVHCEGTSRALEMDLEPWDGLCLATVFSLAFIYVIYLVHAKCGSCHDIKQQSECFTPFKLVGLVITNVHFDSPHEFQVNSLLEIQVFYANQRCCQLSRPFFVCGMSKE